MICADCGNELVSELAWFVCGCGLTFSIASVDEQLDLWCPAGHVYEPREDDDG